jgi:hypothetical protein
MKKYISVLAIFFIFQFGLFGQKEGYPTVMPKPKPNERSNVETVTINKEKFYINCVDFSDSHDGEKSLALAMNKMSDEELLKILKEQLIVGEIVYKKNKD